MTTKRQWFKCEFRDCDKIYTRKKQLKRHLTELYIAEKDEIHTQADVLWYTLQSKRLFKKYTRSVIFSSEEIAEQKHQSVKWYQEQHRDEVNKTQRDHITELEMIFAIAKRCTKLTNRQMYKEEKARHSVLINLYDNSEDQICKIITFYSLFDVNVSFTVTTFLLMIALFLSLFKWLNITISIQIQSMQQSSLFLQ
jgi:hypothetical protein